MIIIITLLILGLLAIKIINLFKTKESFVSLNFDYHRLDENCFRPKYNGLLQRYNPLSEESYEVTNVCPC